MSKGSIASKKAMRDELWRRGELSFLCHPVQKEMRDIYYGSKNHSILVWLLSRQTGKCLEENTLVATPTGPVKIKDLVPGDIVYGFNRDGSVSETEVLAVEAQGKKEVINLFDNANGGIVAKATKEHRWLTINKNTRQYQELSTEDILKSKEHAIISIPQIELPDNQKLITVVETSREEVETYDIQVNNDTNLYLLANGLVTHNSSLLTILALEAAYREKNSIIKIITDTKVHAKTIFIPIFNQFLETCPDEIKPKYMAAEYCYVFENGSRIELAGSDGQHYEKLRGQRSSAVFIDEAGFCSELDVMVNSVLLPTTTHTGGKLVLSSTPPKEFTHPFLNFMERAELEGLLTKKTIDDNPLLTKEQISIIEKQMGGRNSEQFRREYLCHVIKLSTDSALPEVTDELLKNIVKEWQRPPFKDNYMAMDLGFNDLTAVLFGYYDFAKDKIIIEDELPFDYKIKNNTTKVLTSKIQEKEQEIWTNPHTNEISYPVSRVSDINHIVTKDIFENSNKTLYFTAPKKEEKTAMVSSLRILLASEKIIIHPRCENLIRHLKNVKWAKNGKEFARSVDNSHYDFVDALIYLVRSINFKKNPYPLGYGLNLREDNAHIPVNNSTYRGGNVDAFKAIMGMRKR